MANNPFRGKPSPNLQKNVEDWGKTKFKPTKFSKPNSRFGNKKPFHGKFDNRNRNNNKNKDNYKFNQVARDAKPENATPWNKYKDEIVYKLREEEQAALQANMDTEDAKTVLKQREINYRKSLIEQKKQETTVWEDFDEDEDSSEKKKIENNSTDTAINPNNEKKGKKNFNKKDKKNAESKLNAESKTKFKKNVSNSELKADVKEFISKELLDNFDSKKLNFKQNDKLRGAITKTTFLTYGTKLENVVENMKKKKKQKKA